MKKQSFSAEQKKFLKKVGNNIKKRRKELKLSQLEFGYKIDTDKPHISRAESGTHNFSILTAMRFAKGLEIPVSELFE